jgi:hypothetical protein
MTFVSLTSQTDMAKLLSEMTPPVKALYGCDIESGLLVCLLVILETPALLAL